jgi:hypothetical protein
LQLVSNEPEITDSSSRNAVTISSARATKRFSAWIALCHLETVQQTARDQELHGDLTWRGGHESARCSSNRLSAPVECSQFVAKEFQLRTRHFVTQKMNTCEICSRKDKCGVNLISDALPRGRLIGMPQSPSEYLTISSVSPFLCYSIGGMPHVGASYNFGQQQRNSFCRLFGVLPVGIPYDSGLENINYTSS